MYGEVNDLKYVIYLANSVSVFWDFRIPHSFKKDLVLYELPGGVANMAAQWTDFD